MKTLLYAPINYEPCTDIPDNEYYVTNMLCLNRIFRCNSYQHDEFTPFYSQKAIKDIGNQYKKGTIQPMIDAGRIEADDIFNYDPAYGPPKTKGYRFTPEYRYSKWHEIETKNKSVIISAKSSNAFNKRPKTTLDRFFKSHLRI